MAKNFFYHSIVGTGIPTIGITLYNGDEYVGEDEEEDSLPDLIENDSRDGA